MGFLPAWRTGNASCLCNEASDQGRRRCPSLTDAHFSWLCLPCAILAWSWCLQASKRKSPNAVAFGAE